MDRLLLIGLAVAFGTFAAKVGLALSTVRSKRAILITMLIYKLLFLIPLAFKSLFGYIVQPAAKYGITFHMIVSAGLIFWAVWGETEGELASKIMLIPCPFCILAILLSVITGAEITKEPLLIFSLKAYGIFAIIATFFYIAGRKIKISIETVMMASGIYYTTLIALSYYWKEFSSVYRLSLSSFKMPDKIYLTAVFIAIPLIVGFIRGVAWQPKQ